MGSTLPAVRTPSPGTFKRQVWSTPRGGESLGAQTSPRRNSQEPAYAGDYDPSYLPAVDPYADSTSYRALRSDASTSYTELSRAPPDTLFASSAEQAQLAYMDQMYGTIQMLNAELDRERQERAREKMASIEDQVDAYEHAMLSGMTKFSTADMDDEITPNAVVMPIPLAPPAKKTRPQRPTPQSLQGLQLAKDQVELCAALGKNAELRIRSKQMEQSSEKTALELEQAQKQMKLIERRVSNREEKLRILLKEKLHWQKEMKDMRDHVVEEKMRQVDLFRRMESAKREHTAQLDAVEQALRDTEEENQSFRVHINDIKAQMDYQTKKMDDLARQAKEEKEKFVACIAETRFKFKEWRDGEAAALKSSRDQAINNLKTEYDLKMARHQDEKQKLREKVKDLEVSLRLMQKDRTLSPLELSLRKATILGSKDNAGTTEAELIEAHSKIRELESLLEHSQEFQRRQENIIKVSESTISRLMQEREVTALENLSLHPLIGGVNQSSMLMDDNPYAPSSYPGSPQRESPRRPIPKSSVHEAPSKRVDSGSKPKTSTTSSSTGQLRKGIDSPGRFVSPSGIYSSSAALMDTRNLGSQLSPVRRNIVAPSDSRPQFDDRRLDDYVVSENGYGLASEILLVDVTENTFTAKKVQASNEAASKITISDVSSKEQYLLDELARVQRDLDDARSVFDRVKDRAKLSMVDIVADQCEVASSDTQKFVPGKELFTENCDNVVDEPVESLKLFPAQLKLFENMGAVVSELPTGNGEAIVEVGVLIDDTSPDFGPDSSRVAPIYMPDQNLNETFPSVNSGESRFNSIGDEISTNVIFHENQVSSTGASEFVDLNSNAKRLSDADGGEWQVLNIMQPKESKDVTSLTVQDDHAVVTSPSDLEYLELIKTLAFSYGATVSSEMVREAALLAGKLASSLSAVSKSLFEEATSTNEDLELPMNAAHKLPTDTSFVDANDVCLAKETVSIDDASVKGFPVLGQNELHDGSLGNDTSMEALNESMALDRLRSMDDECGINTAATMPPEELNSLDESELETILTQEDVSPDDCIQSDQRSNQLVVFQDMNPWSYEARAAITFMTVIEAEACALVSLKRKVLADPPVTSGRCIASEDAKVLQSLRDSSILDESAQMPLGSDEARAAVAFKTVLDAEACALISMKRKELLDLSSQNLNNMHDNHEPTKTEDVLQPCVTCSAPVESSDEARVAVAFMTATDAEACTLVALKRRECFDSAPVVRKDSDHHCSLLTSGEASSLQSIEAILDPVESKSFDGSTAHKEARTAVAFVTAMGAEACAIVTVKRSKFAQDIPVDRCEGPDEYKVVSQDASESIFQGRVVEPESNPATDNDEKGYIVVRDTVEDVCWPVGAFSRDISAAELPVISPDILSNESASDECQNSLSDSNERGVIESITTEMILVNPSAWDEPADECNFVEKEVIVEDVIDPPLASIDVMDDTEVCREQLSDEPGGSLDVSVAKPVSSFVPNDHVSFIATHMAFAFVSAIKAGACAIVALKRSMRKELESARAYMPTDPSSSTHTIELRRTVDSRQIAQAVLPEMTNDNPAVNVNDSELQGDIVAVDVSKYDGTEVLHSPGLVVKENPYREILSDPVEAVPINDKPESVLVSPDECLVDVSNNCLVLKMMTCGTATAISYDTSAEPESDIVIRSNEVLESEKMAPEHVVLTSDTEFDYRETPQTCEDVLNALTELVNVIADKEVNSSHTPDEAENDTQIDKKGNECFPETMFDEISSDDATFATPLNGEESMCGNMIEDEDTAEARVVYFNEGVEIISSEHSIAGKDNCQDVLPEHDAPVDVDYDVDPVNGADFEANEMIDGSTSQKPFDYITQNRFTYAAYDLAAIEYNLQVILGAIDATALKTVAQNGALLPQDVAPAPIIPFDDTIPDDFRQDEAAVDLTVDRGTDTSNFHSSTAVPTFFREVYDTMTQILDSIEATENDSHLAMASICDKNNVPKATDHFVLVDTSIPTGVQRPTPLAQFAEAARTVNAIWNEEEAIVTEPIQLIDSLPTARILADIKNDCISNIVATNIPDDNVNILDVQEEMSGILYAVHDPIDASTRMMQSVEAKTTYIAPVYEVSEIVCDIQPSLISIDVEKALYGKLNNLEVTANGVKLSTEKPEQGKPAVLTKDNLLEDPDFQAVRVTGDTFGIQPSQMQIDGVAVENTMLSILKSSEKTAVDILLPLQSRVVEELDSDKLILPANALLDESNNLLVNSQKEDLSIMDADKASVSSTDTLEVKDTVLSILNRVQAIDSESLVAINGLDKLGAIPIAEMDDSDELLCEIDAASGQLKTAAQITDFQLLAITLAELEVENTLQSILEAIETTLSEPLLSVVTEVMAPVEAVTLSNDDIFDEMVWSETAEAVPASSYGRELEMNDTMQSMLNAVACVPFVPTELTSADIMSDELISNKGAQYAPPLSLPDEVEVDKTMQSIMNVIVDTIVELSNSVSLETIAPVETPEDIESMQCEVTTGDKHRLNLRGDEAEVSGTIQSILTEEAGQLSVIEVAVFGALPLLEIAIEDTSYKQGQTNGNKVQIEEVNNVVRQVNANAQSVPAFGNLKAAAKSSVIEVICDASSVVEVIEDVIQPVILEHKSREECVKEIEKTKVKVADPDYPLMAGYLTASEALQSAEILNDTVEIVTAMNSIINEVIRSSVATQEQFYLDMQDLILSKDLTQIMPAEAPGMQRQLSILALDNDLAQTFIAQDHSLPSEEVIADETTESTVCARQTVNDDEANNVSKAITGIVEEIERDNYNIEIIALKVATDTTNTPLHEAVTVDPAVNVEIKYEEPQDSSLQLDDRLVDYTSGSATALFEDTVNANKTDDVMKAVSNMVEMADFMIETMGKTTACDMEFAKLQEQSLTLDYHQISELKVLSECADETPNQVAKEVSEVINDAITRMECVDAIMDVISTVADVETEVKSLVGVDFPVAVTQTDLSCKEAKKILQATQANEDSINTAGDVSRVLIGLCERIDADNKSVVDSQVDFVLEEKLILEEMADQTAFATLSGLNMVRANFGNALALKPPIEESGKTVQEAKVNALFEKSHGYSDIIVDHGSNIVRQSERERNYPAYNDASIDFVSNSAENLDLVAISVIQSLVDQVSADAALQSDSIDNSDDLVKSDKEAISTVKMESLDDESAADKQFENLSSALMQNDFNCQVEPILRIETRNVLSDAIRALEVAAEPPNAGLNESAEANILDDDADIEILGEVTKILEEFLITIESNLQIEDFATPTEVATMEIAVFHPDKKTDREESTVSDLLRSVTDSNPTTSFRNAMNADNEPKRRASRRRRALSRRVMESFLFDPTLLAYDVHHEQAQPFSLMDDSLFNIDPNAQHMQFDENDRAAIGITESELIAKKKRMDYDKMRKSIAYRSIPAFNYAQLVIKFQWSDFVVATPITAGDINDKSESLHLSMSPVQKMRLLSKKGVKLPCGSYVIISAFIRPLEDGNENLRVQIYDSEWVEEFQYDFSEDHLREYVAEWNGSAGDAKMFLAKLEFRREEGSIIIRLPEKITLVKDAENERTNSSPQLMPSTPTLTMMSSRERSEPSYHLSTHHSWPLQSYECIDECDESRTSVTSIASNSMRGD